MRVCYQWRYLCSGIWNLGDRKTYKRASNAHVNFYASLGKICAKFYGVLSQKWGMSQFCVISVIFSVGILWIFMARYGTFWHFHDTLWHFWPVTLFCGEFLFVTIYALFWVKLFYNEPYSCKFVVFFHICMQLTKTPGG